jgi:Fe2+ transport system protein FeoA
MDAFLPDASALSDAAVGTVVVLAGTVPEAARALRLAELGLRAGARLQVMSRTPGGGRVVGVGHARIALDRGLVQTLPVRPAS